MNMELKKRTGKMYQVNNSVIFHGKPIGSEEFFLTGWLKLYAYFGNIRTLFPELSGQHSGKGIKTGDGSLFYATASKVVKRMKIK